MAYTPPGIETTVEIENNIVSLPGGTRILALIGMGRDYKCVSGEALVQPSNRYETLEYTNVDSISQIYDFTNSGGVKYYPASGTAGYYESGYVNTSGVITWSPAVNPYPVSTTPVIGESYYVRYSGSGTSGDVPTPVIDTLVQSSGYENVLSSGTGTWTVLGVSGVGITYTASGTGTTGLDSSGFSKDGSGWSLSSSGTMLWSQATGIAYPSASVPPVSVVYYVDYCYNKSASDYYPKNFTDYTSIVNEYGPEAEWSLIVSGTNAGAYQFESLNTLTLAARLAFANGASIVTLTQISGTDYVNNASFTTPLIQLQNKPVDIIVALTAGSGATTTEMSVAEKAALLLDLETHCDTMSMPANKKERIAIGSLGVADIGDTSTANTNTYVYVANSLKDKRVTMTAPGLVSVEIQDPNGEFQTIEVEGSFASAILGAMSCNPNIDVATPLTNKNLSSLSSTSALTSTHTDDQYLESEKNILAAGGVCVIDRAGARIYVRHQLTTDQTNVANGELSVVTTTDYVSQAVRYTTEQFIGKKLINNIVVPAVKATILSTMQQLVYAQLINSVGAVTVSINPNNPTELISTVQYVPIFPLNRIKVTFTIKTQI